MKEKEHSLQLSATQHQQAVTDRLDKGKRVFGILGSSRPFHPTEVIQDPYLNYYTLVSLHSLH